MELINIALSEILSLNLKPSLIYPTLCEVLSEVPLLKVTLKASLQETLNKALNRLLNAILNTLPLCFIYINDILGGH